MSNFACCKSRPFVAKPEPPPFGECFCSTATVVGPPKTLQVIALADTCEKYSTENYTKRRSVKRLMHFRCMSATVLYQIESSIRQKELLRNSLLLQSGDKL